MYNTNFGLETKFMSGSVDKITTKGCSISGYASIFGLPDHSKDVVVKGAFSAGLTQAAARGSKIKMLWQHDPSQPIGVWDEVREDEHGLFVKGHILEDIPQGQQALSLIRAGAIDGLSIGYKTITAQKNKQGQRCLKTVDLWEVSLVTFPMLPNARVNIADTKQDQNVFSGVLDELREIRSLIA